MVVRVSDRRVACRDRKHGEDARRTESDAAALDGSSRRVDGKNRQSSQGHGRPRQNLVENRRGGSQSPADGGQREIVQRWPGYEGARWMIQIWIPAQDLGKVHHAVQRSTRVVLGVVAPQNHLAPAREDVAQRERTDCEGENGDEHQAKPRDPLTAHHLSAGWFGTPMIGRSAASVVTQRPPVRGPESASPA